MRVVNKKASKNPPAQVAGTVHSPGALRHALRLKAGAVDLLELRVDHFASDLAALRQAVPQLRFPWIVTVRHPKEGGSGELPAGTRAELYREFLPGATYVDVELRSAERMKEIIAAAKAREVTVVLSQHYFTRTPSVAELREKCRLAQKLGADLFKVAARTSEPEELARLLLLLKEARGFPLSVMGMGPLGKASRLLFARAGSVLNYGYLGEPQVSGQWPAEVLKKRVEEVLSES
jgi:3-dehydroquinate dehydratase-1